MSKLRRLYFFVALFLIGTALTLAEEENADTEAENESPTSNVQSCTGNNCAMKTYCSGSCNGCPSGRCCDGTDCNICHQGNCCKTRSCNYCFRTCRSNCQYSSCYSNCYSSCLQGKSAKLIDTNNRNKNDGVILKNPSLSLLNGGNKQRKLYNVTTLINITNVINNTNEIENPVFVNTTNRNNIDVNYTIPGHGNGNGDPLQSCCYIVHPLQCVNTPTGPLCNRKKDKVCGPVCLLRQQNLNQQLQPQQQIPLQGQPEHFSFMQSSNKNINKCYPVAHYPYAYCPDPSETENCDNCLQCEGKTLAECIMSDSCPKHCKKGLTPPEDGMGGQQQPMKPFTMPQSAPLVPQYPAANQIIPNVQQTQYVQQSQIPVFNPQQPFVNQPPIGENMQPIGGIVQQIPNYQQQIPYQQQIAFNTGNIPFIPQNTNQPIAFSSLENANQAAGRTNQQQAINNQELYIPNYNQHQPVQQFIPSYQVRSIPSSNIQQQQQQPMFLQNPSSFNQGQGYSPLNLKHASILQGQNGLTIPNQDPKVIVVDTKSLMNGNGNNGADLDYLKKLLNIAQPLPSNGNNGQENNQFSRSANDGLSEEAAKAKLQ